MKKVFYIFTIFSFTLFLSACSMNLSGPDSGEELEPGETDQNENKGPDSGDEIDPSPDSGEEIDTSKPGGPDSGEEIDPDEPTSPDSGEEEQTSPDSGEEEVEQEPTSPDSGEEEAVEPEPTSPDSGDEIDLSEENESDDDADEPSSPDSGDEIDTSEEEDDSDDEGDAPTSPDSGDEIDTTDPDRVEFEEEVEEELGGGKGSCNSIDDSSICVTYSGAYWDDTTMKLHCQGGGTFSKSPCPSDVLGGCKSGAGTVVENIIWNYGRGGDPFTEVIGYTAQACTAVLGTAWIGM